MPQQPQPLQTQMAQAFTAAGYKSGAPPQTPKERLEFMMVQAIAANNGFADPTIDAFIKLLLAEDDATLVWTLVEEVRIPAIRHLFSIVSFRIQQQRNAQQSRTSSGGRTSQQASETQTSTVRSSEAAPTSSGGRSQQSSDTHASGATRPPETASPASSRLKPINTMPAAPSPPPTPRPPTRAVGEALRKTSSKLDMLINGRALGDLDPEEAANVKDLRERDARFIKLLISRLPPGRRHRIRDFITPEEADKLYEIAKQGE